MVLFVVLVFIVAIDGFLCLFLQGFSMEVCFSVLLAVSEGHVKTSLILIISGFKASNKRNIEKFVFLAISVAFRYSFGGKMGFLGFLRGLFFASCLPRASEDKPFLFWIPAFAGTTGRRC